MYGYILALPKLCKALTRAIPSVIARLYVRLILGLWRLWRIYLRPYIDYVGYI
jgi:hypothetical protein